MSEDKNSDPSLNPNNNVNTNSDDTNKNGISKVHLQLY